MFGKIQPRYHSYTAADTSIEMAKMFFFNRFLVEPKEAFIELGLVKVGPVPEDDDGLSFQPTGLVDVTAQAPAPVVEEQLSLF